jgi:peptide/nickel transport system permease protein
VIFKHAFRNALIPVATLFSLNFGAVLSGAIITETVFGWQGMGQLLVQAVNDKEPYMVLGFLMITGVFIIFANLIADVMYAVLDPRIRLD